MSKGGRTVMMVVVFVFFGAFALAVLLPAQGHMGPTSRTSCAANLTGIVKSLILYSAENNDCYPYLGPAEISAKAPTGAVPGGLMNDLYYLVGTGVVAPKYFVCKDDKTAIAAQALASATGMPPYTPTYWTNGSTKPGGADFSYSYSFAFQYSDAKTLGNWWKNTMDSAVAIGADLNPGTKGPWPKGVHNSHTHGDDGQNVGFGDNHVEFERSPACGEADDNIYSVGSKSATAGGCNGMPEFPAASGNQQGTFDTCLVPGAVDAKSFRRQ